ncbi:MAG: secretin N-terminal domain-containing protein [Chromatiales bacterium]
MNRSRMLVSAALLIATGMSYAAEETVPDTFVDSVPAVAEEMVIEVIPLRHALVKDVVPVLEPLVAPGGTVTGMNDRLIVKTTPSNLEELRRTLAAIDRAPRQLRITVRQDVASSLQARGDAVSATGRAGDVRVRVPGTTGGDGASVRVGDRDNNVRYETFSTRAREDSQNTHFVVGLEGRPAWIQTGESLPVPSQNVYVGPAGAVVQDSIEYRDANSGFYVIPRISGNRVTLDIAPQLDRFDDYGGYTVNSQRADTQVAGGLGEWIHLGGANEDFQRADNVNLTSTRQRGGETRGIWVKVEEVQ